MPFFCCSLTVIPGVINTGWADKVSDPEGRKADQELNKFAISSEDDANALFMR